MSIVSVLADYLGVDVWCVVAALFLIAIGTGYAMAGKR